MLCKHGPLSEILTKDKFKKRQRWGGWVDGVHGVHGVHGVIGVDGGGIWVVLG